MKNMTEFTEAVLEVMAKESSPRGRKARMELERRKKVFTGEVSKKVQESVDVVEKDVQESVAGDASTEAPKPKRTRRKPVVNKSEGNS